jgi:hypothetical protein
VTSLTSGRPVASRASARISSAARPRPWKLYGLVGGLYAPPRSMLAPPSATAYAVSSVCARVRAGDEREAVHAAASKIVAGMRSVTSASDRPELRMR